MKILMVIDQFYDANNGMTISARRFVQVLRQHGHDVRIASTGSPELLADRLGLSVRFGFYPKPELLELIAMSDLYVHTSDAEIEAMSCMEAFACGRVPVIADSSKSATPQFALDRRSLFEAGNSSDLADRIDYWLEHPEERAQMEIAYAELAKQYNLDACVRQVEAMFEQAIAENAGQEDASHV